MRAWTAEWLSRAQADLLRVHWETAARIDAAVQRFAAMGDGPVRRVVIGSAVQTRLLVPPYAAVLVLDRRARIVWVWEVVRYAP